MNFRIDLDKLEEKNSKKPVIRPAKENNNLISIRSKLVVVTGKIPNKTRSQVTNILNNYDCMVQDHITTSTGCLITGETFSILNSKYRNASAFKIPIISYKNIKELQ
jgi:NAD-dependent DNA ligase